MSVWVLTILFLSSWDSTPKSQVVAGSFDTYEQCVAEGTRSTGSSTRNLSITFVCAKKEGQ